MTVEEIISALDRFWDRPKEERTMENLAKAVPGVMDVAYTLAAEIMALKKRVEFLEERRRIAIENGWIV